MVPRLTASPTRFALGAIALLSATPALADLGLPPRPSHGDLLYDEAKLLQPGDAAEVRALQAEALREHKTPIVVVTIASMSSYRSFTTSIESFSREWFDHWGLGGAGRNNGILLLVARLDRRARIELGGDWGHRWDGYSERVMQNTLVPAFKARDYSSGIVDGVARLFKMAERGPRRSPPRAGPVERLRGNDTYQSFSTEGFISSKVALGMLLIGLGLIVLGVFVPSQRKWLIIVGIALVLGAISIFIWIGIAALFSKGRYRGYTGGYTGGFSGGGYSGGSSGGGGASGSW